LSKFNKNDLRHLGRLPTLPRLLKNQGASHEPYINNSNLASSILAQVLRIAMLLFLLFVLVFLLSVRHLRLTIRHWAASPGSSEPVDSAMLFSAMGDHSMRLDSQNNPHIAFGGDHLYYASYNGSTWELETVDDLKGVGFFTSLFIDRNDHLISVISILQPGAQICLP
jgi:hypothetical protein